MPLRIFFVSDIHGSEICFRKFVNAGRFYGVDAILMGGDLSGKLLIPIVQEGPRWVAKFRGARMEAETESELAQLERRLSNFGPYTLRTTREFVQRLHEDQELVEATLKQLIVERAQRWVTVAAERLQGSQIQCLIGLGNDDYDELIPIFDSPPVQYARDGLMDFGEFVLGSLGWSNPTPWHTNRERPEEALATMMETLSQAPDPNRTIYNIHVPPYNSGLDSAPRLDADLQVQLVGGQPDMIPVGSTAVAEGIRRFGPLLSLHGHIHESKAVVKWNNSTIVNPGSEYDQGSLLGALIEVKPGRVTQCQLVTG